MRSRVVFTLLYKNSKELCFLLSERWLLCDFLSVTYLSQAPCSLDRLVRLAQWSLVFLYVECPTAHFLSVFFSGLDQEGWRKAF